MIINKHRINNIIAIIPLSLIAVVCLPVSVLPSATVSAVDNTSVVDRINITVPVSCTMSGTGMNTHNAEITNGTYNSAIGETTLKAFCNDNEGFAIYAIGYTDNLNGKNVLTSSVLGSTHDIVTGTSTTGANSNWAMKLSTVSSPVPTYPIIIAGSSDDTERESGDPDFTSFQQIPNDYALVAKRTGGTDIGTNAEGSTLKTTYQAYISQTQPAGTYTGQVKYTLIHPHDNAAPLATMLDTGPNVSIKMRNLSAGTTDATSTTVNTLIKAIHTANTLPQDFVATEANTVSVPDSKYPIYIFFDNTNDAGIMYFYTEGNSIGMNSDSRSIFCNLTNLVDLTGLADWDASMAKNFRGVFSLDTSLTSLNGLENWNVGNVEDMMYLFYGDTALADLSALQNWNTRSVTNLRQFLAMGTSTTSSALTTLDGLEDWNVSNVKNMYGAISANGSLTDISALAEWDVSSVENLSVAFLGDTSLTTLHGLEKWNTKNVTTLEATFYRCSSLIDISALSNWDTSNVINLNETFARDTSLASAHGIENWDTSSITSMIMTFNQDVSLESIDVSNWDTSNVITMRSMFNVGENYAGNGQLTEIIGLGDLDVSNVYDMTSMFYGAGQMTHYDIADWDVSKVESFNHMFCDNKKLESLDLSKWDVSSVKTMYDMFDDNYKLTTIGDVSHWNTVSLIDVGGWLNGATSFVGDNGTLDLSGWNTSNLKSTNEMFRATKLETIDLSGWTFDAITNSSWEGAGSGIYYEYSTAMSTMFKDTAQLNTVYLSQLGLDSFNAAVNRGVRTTDMWSGSAISSFTVK